MIPKIIHRVWAGREPQPEYADRFGRTWIEKHPHADWDYYQWGEQTALPALNSEVLARVYADAAPVVKSAILRYFVLYVYGGVYVDMDVECIQSIEPYLNREVLLAYEPTHRVIGNAVMGAVPGHPFLERVLTELPAHYEAETRDPVWRTGPRYLTSVYHKFEPKFEVIEDRRIFYPYSWEESHRVYPETVTAHHWAQSWRK